MSFTPKAWGFYWEDSEGAGSWGIGMTEEEAKAEACYDPDSVRYVACSGECDTLEECYAWILSERAHISEDEAAKALTDPDTRSSWFPCRFDYATGAAILPPSDAQLQEFEIVETYEPHGGGLMSLSVAPARTDMRTIRAASPERAMLKAYNDDPEAEIWHEGNTVHVHHRR